jgi:hypothetical protein
MSIPDAPRRKARSGSKWVRRACPPSEKDVDQQQNRQSQTDSEMNPTRPCTKAFATRVIKTVAGNGQNGERTQKNRSVCSIAARAPSESDVRAQKHSDQHQNCHRRSAMDFHRPSFRACLKILRPRGKIIPICPCHSAQKKQRQHGVEKISLQALQSNRVWSRVSHGE